MPKKAGRAPPLMDKDIYPKSSLNERSEAMPGTSLPQRSGGKVFKGSGLNLTILT